MQVVPPLGRAGQGREKCEKALREEKRSDSPHKLWLNASNRALSYLLNQLSCICRNHPFQSREDKGTITITLLGGLP